MAKEKTKTIKLPISSHIDTKYRSYAIYVIENRGISSWYDGLTNVQRIILNNAKPSFDKTLTLIGNCISDNYIHGDSSLEGAINKLARPFGCAEQLLIGDGSFGTKYVHEAAAARYTSVKINSDIAKIIKENNFLNSKTDEGKYNPLRVNYPIGLNTLTIGIAVGYSSTILPRKEKDIQRFFDGKCKEVKPYFKNFNGKISRYKDFDKTWLIEGVIEFDDFRQKIHITDLPPMMKPSSFIKKLDKLIESHSNKCIITNKSADEIDLTIKFNGFKNDWEHFKTVISKTTKMLVTENIVFIKDGMVIQYDKIEDYLTDFKYRIAEIEYKRAEYFYNETCFDLEYNKAKKEYFEFMLKQKRNETEISKFLTKFKKQIANKLDSIYLRFLNEQELQRTIDKIKDLEELKKQQKTSMVETKKKFDSMIDVSVSRGIKHKAAKGLLDDIDNIDGIDFFIPEDVNEENNETENEQ